MSKSNPNSSSATPSAPTPSGSHGTSAGGVLWDIVTAPAQVLGDIGKTFVGEGNKK